MIFSGTEKHAHHWFTPCVEKKNRQVTARNLRIVEKQFIQKIMQIESRRFEAELITVDL